MFITFSPQRRDDSLEVSKSGDVLMINGTAYDLSMIPDDATLPAEAIASEWFCGPVTRHQGVLTVHLLLPHGPKPTPEQAFPSDLIDPPDGPITLPRGAEEPSHEPTFD